MLPVQVPLPFEQPAPSEAGFIDGPESAIARAALARWREWPGGAFVLWGEAGCGKTHMATAWAQSARTQVVEGAALSAAMAVALPAALLAVDGADQAGDDALFAILTRVDRDGGAVLLTAAAPPELWPVRLRDLASRLAALNRAEILPPEPSLMAALLIRRAAAAGVLLDPDAANWLAWRMPRSHEAVRAAGAFLASAPGRADGVRTGMALARHALRALEGGSTPQPGEPMGSLLDLMDPQ